MELGGVGGDSTRAPACRLAVLTEGTAEARVRGEVDPLRRLSCERKETAGGSQWLRRRSLSSLAWRRSRRESDERQGVCSEVRRGGSSINHARRVAVARRWGAWSMAGRRGENTLYLTLYLSYLFLFVFGQMDTRLESGERSESRVCGELTRVLGYDRETPSLRTFCLFAPSAFAVGDDAPRTAQAFPCVLLCLQPGAGGDLRLASCVATV